jgi:thiol-disulfide isomerase/thioredoxin
VRIAVAAALAGLCLGAAVAPAAAAPTARVLPRTARSPAGLRLTDLAGRPVRIEDYRGKVLLVSFWATWCEFCREQMLAMHRLQARMAGQPFEMLAVNFGESTRHVRAHLRDLPVGDLRVVMDPDQAASKAWRVRVLPVNFLVDPQGRTRYTVLGEYDWGGDEAVGMIRRLMR